MRALEGWQFAKSAAGARKAPLDALDLEWLPAEVPGTVAARLWGEQSISYSSSLPLDDDDFWYRVEFRTQGSEPAEVWLHMDGLATFAEVWLDDNLILESDNMFCAHSLNVSEHCEKVDTSHWLYIRFCALTPFFNLKHTRAKWRTPFVQHRNLRFVRTSLIGRLPGLQPLIPVVGPWRPVALEEVVLPRLSLSSINVELVDKLGVIDIVVLIQGLLQSLDSDSLRLYCEGEGSTKLEIVTGDEEGFFMARGRLEIENPDLWWPHTHGVPAIYHASVKGRVGGKPAFFDIQPIGFRTVKLLDPFTISVNGVQLFCRGACWRPLEILSMNPTSDRLRRVLDLAVSAGMNMLRITGEAAYETDEFYRLCDELGIMLWQDFMFARLDYPVDDGLFLKSIIKETTQLLERLAPHPCLTVLCGNTEVAQQAAMLGLEREKWSNIWFDSELPNICDRLASGIPFWRSSPDGGDMPFYTDSGVSHYFGVGVYRQELSDAVVNAPVFASECLAFGIPSLGSHGTSSDSDAVFDSPADPNAKSSFLDVAEYYAMRIYGADFTKLKDSDVHRYQILCALAVGELMYYVQSWWRRKNIHCKGSLVIALNDVVEGNGWGVLDSQDNPKAPYFFLKRAWSPLGLILVDQGVNGLQVIVHNDHPSNFVGCLRLSFCRYDGFVVFGGEQYLNLEARSTVELSAESVIGHFLDSSYTYQFGDPAFDFALGELVDSHGEVVRETVTVSGENQFLAPQDIDIDILIDVIDQEDGRLVVTLTASKFVQSLSLVTNGYELSDNYFHLLPNRVKVVSVKAGRKRSEFQMTVSGLNMSNRLNAEYSFASAKTRLTS